ncbi:MAG: helix-turn-helix domain-containing protein [Actinomycetota bacterium]|nr:helix-turn-helix domain-containing protein [Actinomycetota bacterium]
MVKYPEERKIELLQAAKELFYKQGYEQTSVQNIVEAVGIVFGDTANQKDFPHGFS